MIGMKSAMTRAAMSGLYHSGAHRLLAPYTQGAGVIFTLNQVRPPQDKDFAPNRGLEVAPEFLEAMLDQVEEEGLDVVTLDEAARRLREDESAASSASPSTRPIVTRSATPIPCSSGARCRSPSISPPTMPPAGASFGGSR